MQPESTPDTPGADFTLRIAPVIVQLDPSRAISTIGYNGTSPGARLAHARGQTGDRGRGERDRRSGDLFTGTGCSFPRK